MPQLTELKFEDMFPELKFDNRLPELNFGDKLPELNFERKSSLLKTIKEHPFKSILQPITKTLGKKTIEEKYQEKVVPEILKDIKYPFKMPLEIDPSVLLATAGGVGAEIADIIQTPSTFVPLPIGKLIGKIPIKGTTLGTIAKTTPIGKGFMKNITELGRYEQTLKAMAQRGTSTVAEQFGIQGPVQKIIQALKEAKPIRGKQEELYSAERAKRVAEVIEAGKVGGEQAYFKQLGALKGELPKVQFEGIRGKITQLDVDSLFNTVEQNQVLSPFEKITTKNGLAKLLGTEGGVVPTKGELSLLGEVFPQDFIKTVLTKRPLLQKVGQGIPEVLNVPRAIMASTDLSFLFRQGLLAIRHPIIFSRGAMAQFKYFFNEKAYQNLYKDIQSRATYPLMKEAKLDITKIGAPLIQREEAFMSNLAEKIPFAGKIIRASDRAYTGLANKLRADWFDWMVNVAQKQGQKIEGKLLTDIGNFVNTATGRGSLGNLEKAAVILNTTFFSPRLMASRLNLLNPIYYTKLDPFVRKEALKSLLTLSGTALGVTTLAKMGGAEVGIDPRSADFGKIKIGNTRYDILGGFQQYIRLGAQLITGEHISSTTGVKTTVGEGYKPLTRLDILGRFFQTKENPILSFATNLLRGQSTFGQKLDIQKEVGTRFVPMVIQDMYDLQKERGLEGIAMGIPAIFGVGVQTYAPTAQEMVYSANSVLTNYKELLKQGKIKEARDLYSKNKDIIRIGKTLEGTQKIISNYEKLKENAKKNVRLTPEQKQQKIAEYNERIKGLQAKLEERYKTIKKPKIDFQPLSQ